MTIEGIEFGFAVNEETEWCAKKIDVESRMLCGRKKGFVPAVQPPFTPSKLHDACRDLLYRDGAPRQFRRQGVEYGTCPNCLGEAPVRAGVVLGHGVWTYEGGRWRVTGRECDGAGHPPEDDE